MLERRIELSTTIAQVANEAANVALDRLWCPQDRRSVVAALARAGRLYFIAFPAAALVVGYGAHEGGHTARAVDSGWTDLHLDITKWPWPTPYIRASGYGVGPPGYRSANSELYNIASGEEGSRRMAEAMLDRVYATDTSHYFDWILLGYARLEFTAYALYDLTPAVVADPSRLFNGGYDFRAYAIEFTSLTNRTRISVDDFQKTARRLRRDAFLNVADMSLVSALLHTWRYIRDGETTTGVSTLSVHGIRVAAGAFASLGADGPERGLNAIVVLDRLFLRGQFSHIDAYGTTDLWAGTLTSRWRRDEGISPRFSAEVRQAQTEPEWTSRTTAHRHGQTLRVGTGATGDLRLGSRPAEWDFDLSYKTRGYLPGLPTPAGLSAGVGITVAF